MPKEVYCNKCGKKMAVWDIQSGLSCYGKLEYGSKYDGNYYCLDLCCDCLDELIGDCMICPLEEP